MTSGDFVEYENQYSSIQGDRDFPDTSNTSVLPWSGRFASGIADSALCGTMPPTWGGEEDPDYGSVTGWVKVCDVIEQPKLVLLAALWGGRLWLKFSESESAPSTPEGVFIETTELPLYQPAVYVAQNAANRGQGLPQGWLLADAETARTAPLTKEGKWRADIEIAPLCTFVLPKNGETMITLWVWTVDGVIGFSRTERELSFAVGYRPGYGSDWMQRNSYASVGRDGLTREEWQEADSAGGGLGPRTAEAPWGAESFEAPSTALFQQSTGNESTWGSILREGEDDDCAGGLNSSLRLYAGRHFASYEAYANSFAEAPYVYRDEDGLHYESAVADKNYHGGMTLMEWTKLLWRQGYVHVNWSIGKSIRGQSLVQLPASDSYVVWRQPKHSLYDPEAADGRGFHPQGRKKPDQPMEGSDMLCEVIITSAVEGASAQDNAIDDAHCTEAWAGKNWGEWADGPKLLTSTQVVLDDGTKLAIIIGGASINDTLITESLYGYEYPPAD